MTTTVQWHLDHFRDAPLEIQAAHLTRDHGWTLFKAEADDRTVLRAMHAVAHQHDTYLVTHPDDRRMHSCHLGPLCAYWHSTGHSHPEDPGGCIHSSCMQIMNEDCGQCYEDGLLAAWDEPDTYVCPRHGFTWIASQGYNPGYAGGAVYWANLACGCHEMDDTDDVRAAY